MANREIVFVSGSFDTQGGKPSVYAQKLQQELASHMPGRWEVHNGGTLEDLQRVHDGSAKTANILIWLPDVEKGTRNRLVSDLKKNNQKTMLVTDQDNSDGRYERKMLVAKALDQKANLILEVIAKPDGQVQTTILDPLNNIMADKESDVSILAHRLATRIEQLISIKRTSSQKVGDAIPCPIDNEVKQFLEVVREHASTFHDLIHIPNQGRSLGNISFRCERGFPAARASDPNLIYISKRNVDKRYITPDDMVAVRLDSDDPVQYYAQGDMKPSIDGPIQIGLFKQFPKVNYILHSHTYIEGAPFTDNIYPCGAAEELGEITEKFKDAGADKILINLRGHGSVAMVSNWRELKNIPYVAREEIDKLMPWEPPAAPNKFTSMGQKFGIRSLGLG